jgi:hypothetical protein
VTDLGEPIGDCSSLEGAGAQVAIALEIADLNSEH